MILTKDQPRNGTALYSLKLCHIRSEAIPNIIKNEGGGGGGGGEWEQVKSCCYVFCEELTDDSSCSFCAAKTRQSKMQNSKIRPFDGMVWLLLKPLSKPWDSRKRITTSCLAILVARDACEHRDNRCPSFGFVRFYRVCWNPLKPCMLETLACLVDKETEIRLMGGILSWKLVPVGITLRESVWNVKPMLVIPNHWFLRDPKVSKGVLG